MWFSDGQVGLCARLAYDWHRFCWIGTFLVRQRSGAADGYRGQNTGRCLGRVDSPFDFIQTTGRIVALQLGFPGCSGVNDTRGEDWCVASLLSLFVPLPSILATTILLGAIRLGVYCRRTLLLGDVGTSPITYDSCCYIRRTRLHSFVLMCSSGTSSLLSFRVGLCCQLWALRC